MLALEPVRRYVDALTITREGDPFIFTPQMIVELQLLTFIHQALSLASRWRPIARPGCLPCGKRLPFTIGRSSWL